MKPSGAGERLCPQFSAGGKLGGVMIYSFFFLYTFGEIGGENRRWGQHVFLPFNGTLLSCWGKAGEREKKDKGSLIIFSVGWIKATPNGAGSVSLALEIV